MDKPLPADVAYAYIPLTRNVVVAEADAGAVAIGDGVAVTAAHAIQTVPKADVIGISAQYDIAFFRTDRTRGLLKEDVPRVGAHVVAYAHYGDALYYAQGVVADVAARVEPNCSTCIEQDGLIRFVGNAGQGYSGGPVLDRDSGSLIGILFAYADETDGTRSLYAYPMGLVRAELAKLLAPQAK